jgi:hypothetical protein
VGDLFADFDFDQLPDAVNQPTYDRLCHFLQSGLKQADLVPPVMTVRAIVNSIKKFNTSATLCWLLAGGVGGERSAWDDGLDAFGLTQRVFAQCAGAVLKRVQATVAAATSAAEPVSSWLMSAAHGEMPSAGEIVRRQGADSEASAAPVVQLQPDLGLVDWLTAQKLAHLGAALQQLGVSSFEDLLFGVDEGDITPEVIVSASGGAVAYLQAKRLVRLVSSHHQ